MLSLPCHSDVLTLQAKNVTDVEVRMTIKDLFQNLIEYGSRRLVPKRPSRGFSDMKMTSWTLNSCFIDNCVLEAGRRETAPFSFVWQPCHKMKEPGIHRALSLLFGSVVIVPEML